MHNQQAEQAGAHIRYKETGLGIEQQAQKRYGIKTWETKKRISLHIPKILSLLFVTPNTHIRKLRSLT